MSITVKDSASSAILQDYKKLFQLWSLRLTVFQFCYKYFHRLQTLSWMIRLGFLNLIFLLYFPHSAQTKCNRFFTSLFLFTNNKKKKMFQISMKSFSSLQHSLYVLEEYNVDMQNSVYHSWRERLKICNAQPPGDLAHPGQSFRNTPVCAVLQRVKCSVLQTIFQLNLLFWLTLCVCN